MVDRSNFDEYTKITPLKMGVDRLLSNLDPTGEKLTTQNSVKKLFLDIVGPSAASQVCNVYLRGRQLVVEVSSPIWANELSLFITPYIEKMNAQYGADLIDSIIFTVPSRRHRFKPL